MKNKGDYIMKNKEDNYIMEDEADYDMEDDYFKEDEEGYVPKNAERVPYLTYEEAVQNKDDPDYELYYNLFVIMRDICDILHIPIPYLSIQYDPLILYNDFGGVLDIVYATVYKPGELYGPNVDNALLRISLDGLDEESIVSTLAHELRHIWQWCHRTDLPLKHARGKETLFDPAEIDADAFAIWFLCARCGAPLKLAGMIACVDVISENPKAYQKREKMAKEYLEKYN